MVNGINSNFQIQNVQLNKPSRIPAQDKNVTNPIDNYTMAGLESLGVYNMSLVKNKENFDHKPAELIVPADTKMSQINGEKVCDPYGKLEYIVQNDSKYETRYYADDEDTKAVGHIEVRDAYDGKLLKEQNCGNDGHWADITEYSQEQPNVNYFTSYRDGKLNSTEKEEKMPDGSIKRYSKSFYNKNPELGIRLQDKNHKNSIDVAFDSQNVVKNIDVQKEIGNTSYSKYIKFNKGAVIGMNEYKDTVVPNFMEREVLNDNDVMPTEKFDREKLETMAKNSPSDIYSFFGNGSLKEINDKNIKIEFNEDGSQYIREYLNDSVTKTTFYKDDGSVSVHYQDGDTIKNLEISSENKPRFYSITESGKNVRAANFTDEGYLSWCE